MDLIVRDLNTVTLAVARLYDRNRCTLGVYSVAVRVLQAVDVLALTICIDFLLTQPPNSGAHRVAARLWTVLDVVACRSSAVEARRRAA